MSLSIYSPIMTVVLSEKCLSHRLSKSQRELPSKSMTITQQFPSFPMLKTLGMLISSPIYLDFAKSIINLLSNSSCDRLTTALSILRATSEPSLTLRPRQIQPKAPQPNFFTIQQQFRTRLDFSPMILEAMQNWIIFVLKLCIDIIILQFKKKLQIMFQPHSVRGLLSRRNASRIQQDSNDIQTNGDPDLEAVVQTKLIIKDIDHQIEDIRQWRDHQKIILNERLASNKAVADTLVQSYLGNLQKQEKRDAEQKLKLLNNLHYTVINGAQYNQSTNYQDTNLFEQVTNSNKLVEECKYEVSSEAASLLVEQTLVNEVNVLNELMLKVRQGKSQFKKQVDPALLKKELEEIDAELREVQELIND